MVQLPPCDCRVKTGEMGIYQCRHPKVHANANLVERAVCAMCQYCAAPCPSPRSLEPGEVVDVRKMPPLQTRAWSLTKSLASFVADGLRTVTDEQYAQRLSICDGCAERRENYCLQCGCYLAWKAMGRAFQCPLKKWPDLRSDDLRQGPSTPG